VIPRAGVDEGTGVPWAMQIVVRVEKSAPPQHSAVLCATASAVALALATFTDPDAEPGVRGRTERWRHGPIRKVVRRARGAGWNRQLVVPGAFTHRAHGVEVAVHVPGPVDALDPEIARLQVGGLSLDDDVGPCAAIEGDVEIFVNPHLSLTTGKAAAQVAHAAQLVLQTIPDVDASAWVAAAAPVQVTTAGEAEWERLLETAPVVVTDGGFTEVPPGTRTVVARHPWDERGPRV
jgi:peptidyl-tRNA hydrolase